MAGTAEQTPCCVMFDIFKRSGRIKHNELAELILSGRPLSAGRSPASRASDRSWVSRFIVHAPAASLQARYFADFGASSRRVIARLRSRRGGAMSDEQIIAMVCGADGRAMDRALLACHQSAGLYRNALERLSRAQDKTPSERAEAVVLLFIASGCSANVREAVEFTMASSQGSYGLETSTPSAVGRMALQEAQTAEACRPLGLVRIEGSYVCGGPFWIDPSLGAEIGALAMGERDVTDVAADVSGRHARVWRGEDGRWLVRDLGSKNGTRLVDGATGESAEVSGEEPRELHPGDELRLAGSTVFVVVEGAR